MLLLQTATCYTVQVLYAVVADSNLLQSVQYKYAVVADSNLLQSVLNTYAVVADSNLLESVQYKYAVVAVCRVFRISVMSQQSTQYECADQCFDSIIRGPLDPD